MSSRRKRGDTQTLVQDVIYDWSVFQRNEVATSRESAMTFSSRDVTPFGFLSSTSRLRQCLDRHWQTSSTLRYQLPARDVLSSLFKPTPSTSSRALKTLNQHARKELYLRHERKNQHLCNSTSSVLSTLVKSFVATRYGTQDSMTTLDLFKQACANAECSEDS